MKYLSLFSGIEAATVAWHNLGWQPIAFAENEPFPAAVLAQNLPDVPNWGDVTKFKDWPNYCQCDKPTNDATTTKFCRNCHGLTKRINLIVGGSPCQAFSVAGLRKGLDDPRGNLALTYLAIIDRYKPEWIVWENVPGVLSSNGGRDFGTFIRALDAIGYGYAWRVLDAQHVRTTDFPGAVPQRRRRVFVVGHFGNWRRAAAVLFDSESGKRNIAPGRQKGQTVADSSANSIGTNSNIADTVTAKWSKGAEILQQGAVHGGNCILAHAFKIRGGVSEGNGQNGGKIGQSAGKGYLGADELAFTVASTQDQTLAITVASNLDNLHIRRFTPMECERLQGFPDDWTRIPWKKKTAENCPDGPRYKAIGNSMAVNVMQWLGIRIAMVDELIKDQT